MTTLSRLSRRITYRITAILLLFTFTVPAAAHQFTPSSLNVVRETNLTQQTNLYSTYDISPPSGVPGRAYFVNIISRDPDKKQITDKTVILAPGINVTNVSVSNNGLSAKITIPDDTPLGRIQFVLKDKEGPEGTIFGVAEFEVTSIAASAIPPGLDPEVDVMWGVMAQDVVRHNFGRKIAKHYYGIQLSLGNNSGFDIQIASVGFKLPDDTKIVNTLPTNSYRATRGTLERQQELGTRVKILSSLRTAGLLMTGFLPFWHALGPAANAARVADIVNGPVITGFELISPDTVLSHLTRLDDQTLRDGLIIKNNSQVRTTVFVAKQVLDIDQNEGDDNAFIAKKGRDCKKDELGDCNKDKAPNRFLEKNRKKKLNYREDPQYVNLRLGNLVLIGQPIKYLNRLQVIRTAEGGPVTPPPTVVGVNPQTVEQGADKEPLTIPGSYLENAVITPKDPDTNTRISGIEFTDTASDSSGRMLKTKVSVKDDVPPKKYTLVVSTTGGSLETTLEIIQGRPSGLGDITYVDGSEPAPNDKEDRLVKIKITGKYLEGSQIIIPAESKGKLIAEADAKAKGGELVQTIRVVKGTPAGSYKLQIKNKNPNTVELPKPFVIKEAKK